jgi:RNA polymerase sigma-70 factor (ECF subfamily)
MERRADSFDQRAALMAAAQDGDAAAYARLLRDLVPLLRGFVRRRLKTPQTQNAEDIVQEILLSIHVARATYDRRRPFLPWAMAIAHHRLADAARRRGRIAANEMVDEELLETFLDPQANAPDGSYGDVEALRHAMAGLPAGQRVAIEAVKLREMSLKEAAAATGTSIGALKVSVHRGIKALRTALAHEGRT